MTFAQKAVGIRIRGHGKRQTNAAGVFAGGRNDRGRRRAFRRGGGSRNAVGLEDENWSGRRTSREYGRGLYTAHWRKRNRDCAETHRLDGHLQRTIPGTTAAVQSRTRSNGRDPQ